MDVDPPVEVGESASARFFSAPDIVQRVLPHLARERVDLLALSLVSKLLRPLALQVWAHQLDVPFTEAERKFNFFEANPHLYNQVKRLRVTNNLGFAFTHMLNFDRGPRRDAKFRSLRGLLSRIGDTAIAKAVDPPLLDLAIVLEDCAHIPASLQTHIVALRVLPTGPTMEEILDESELGFFDPRANPPPDPASAFTPGNWQDLTELIQRASQGPGLHTLRIHNDKAESATARQVAAQSHSSTLRDIACAYVHADCVASGLLSGTYPRLQSFSISALDMDRSAAGVLDAFLDRHLSLVHLELDINEPPGPDLSLRQTFPSLRSIRMKSVFDDEDFVQRHQHVLSSVKYRQRSDHWCLDPELGSSPEFGNQRIAVVCRTKPLERIIEAGAPLTQLILHSDGRDGTLFRDYFTLLDRSSMVAARITCLELVADVPDYGEVNKHFDPAAFCNLIEVGVLMLKVQTKRTKDSTGVEAHMAAAVSFFLPAKQLRVLRICDGRVRCLQQDALLGHGFPLALEYFAWHEPPRRVPQYFRFVGSCQGPGDEGGVSGPKDGGKRGRLQRVPTVFLRSPLMVFGSGCLMDLS
ncbi:hypothetical protein V8E36_005276 [Tilletia maclaganii]